MKNKKSLRCVLWLAVAVVVYTVSATAAICQANEKPAPVTPADIEKTERLFPAANQLLLKLQNDPQRPKYHFMAPWGWINDPNGAIFWKGKYHLFYQFNPNAAYWQRIQWGHASSTDLCHWTHHPIALAPEDGKPDRNGCYSGMAVVNNGVPTLIYLAVPDGIALATCKDDDLINWTKHPKNPVIPYSTPGKNPPYRVYDPCAWKHGDTWYALSGWGRCFSRPNYPEGDIAFLFKSKDMINWEYMHPFYESNRKWTDGGEDCACPNFFPLGDKHVLLFCSHKRGSQYYVGRYANDKFEIEHHGRTNWTGGQIIAPISMLDGRGRRLFFGWIHEGCSKERHRAAGWAGLMTLPRVITLATDGKQPALRMQPVPEIESLRYNHRRVGQIALEADSPKTIDEIRGDCLEIQLEIDTVDSKQCGLIVRSSPDGVEQTRIFYDAASKQLKIDGDKSSLIKDPRPRVPFLPADEIDIQVQAAPLELAPGEPLKLRVFLDRSVVEVFANGRQAMAQRIYPSRDDSQEVRVFSNGGRAQVKHIEAWDMASTGTF